MLMAWVVLVALLLVTVALLIRPAWTLFALLVGLAVLWLPVNRPVEGAVLLTFSEDHGLTVADLLVPFLLPVLVLSAIRLLRRSDTSR